MREEFDAEQRAGRAGTSRLEWVAAACGALLLTSLVGYLTYIGLTKPEGSPKIVVLQDAVEDAPGGFVQRFTARNDGNSTAAAVKVKGRLTRGEQVLEEAEAVIDYVPERSKRQGGLFFERDPRQHEMSLRAEGYAKP